MATRQQVSAELTRLRKIKFVNAIASQRHRGRGVLMERVQRQEDRRYRRRVKRRITRFQRLLDIEPERELFPRLDTSKFNLNTPRRTLTRIASKRRLRGKR